MTRSAPLITPVLIAGCVILMLGFAIRASFGVFQIPIAEEFGWARAEFSLAIAVQNLAWGIGQPLFGAVTPDGYKNTQAAWLNPDALNRRINFAASYASGRLPLDKPEDEDKIRSSKASLRQLERAQEKQATQAPTKGGLDSDALLATLGSSVSEKTRNIIDNNPKNLRAAMVLGSPDFMRR